MRRLLCACIALTFMSVWAQADEIADVGRALLTKHDSALVTLRLTVKESYSSPGQGTEEEEFPLEAPATVVDAAGLAVTSLSMVDPTAMMESEGDDEGYEYSIQVTGAKMLLADGKELPAKLVLQDKDLDVAVFRLEQAPAAPMGFVDMAAAGTPEALDTLILLSRLGKVVNRTSGAGVVRINAAPKKPRQYFVIAQGEAMIGAPAFNLKGEPVGLVTLRWIKGADDEMSSMFGTGSSMEIPIVLPASDLLEVVKLAREEKPEAAPAPAAAAAPAPAPAP